MEEKQRFKNQADIEKFKLVDCPPKNAISKKMTAFRYVNNPIRKEDFNNYIKLGKLPRQTEKSHEICSRCGLSMFNTLSAAIAKYNNLPKKSSFEYTHVAKGELHPDDGKCSDTNKLGHFTFHEFYDCDLVPKFKIETQLT